MHSYDFALLLAFFAIVLLPAPWLGRFYFNVMEGQRTWLTPLLGPVERGCYRLAGVRADQEQNWKQYALALLAFNLAGFVLLFSVLLLQGYLPLNPQHLPGQEWSLAFNTAVSFVTNTNWQAYSGEASVSYLSQMLGLTVQNFVSAATGLAVLVALCRGISRRSTSSIGNFWVDMTRATLYGLLPLCLVLALLLVWQGVPQTFADYAHAVTLQGADQTIPLGPAASQIAIKQLGTNGGGFFGVNSSHPFENPTAWSNLFEVASIILIPAALVFTFGHYVKDLRQSRAILACMLGLFLIGGATALWSEHQPNPALDSAQVQQSAPLEGKESRFGTTGSVLWTVTTTAASNGSVNAMHDSLNPLTGMVAMVNMMVGEVIFGGVGAGLYGMLLFVLIAVFLAGLMIGRTPEYLGKKLQAREVQLLVATLLVMPVGVLVLGAIAASLPGPAGPCRRGQQSGCTWFQPVAVRLHLGRREQRLGVRRVRRQHRVPQRDDRPGHAHRPLWLHPADPGLGRQPGSEKKRAARAEQLPYPRPAVHRPAACDHPAGGRPDLPAGPGPWANR